MHSHATLPAFRNPFPGLAMRKNFLRPHPYFHYGFYGI